MHRQGTVPLTNIALPVVLIAIKDRVPSALPYFSVSFARCPRETLNPNAWIWSLFGNFNLVTCIMVPYSLYDYGLRYLMDLNMILVII